MGNSIIYTCTECGQEAEECTKLERCCDACYDKIESYNSFN